MINSSDLYATLYLFLAFECIIIDKIHKTDILIFNALIFMFGFIIFSLLSIWRNNISYKIKRIDDLIESKRRQALDNQLTNINDSLDKLSKRKR